MTHSPTSTLTSLQLTALLRPTSNNSGGLVLRVKGAAASSVLCHNLAGVALDEGEVGGVLKNKHIKQIYEHR